MPRRSAPSFGRSCAASTASTMTASWRSMRRRWGGAASPGCVHNRGARSGPAARSCIAVVWRPPLFAVAVDADSGNEGAFVTNQSPKIARPACLAWRWLPWIPRLLLLLLALCCARANLDRATSAPLRPECNPRPLSPPAREPLSPGPANPCPPSPHPPLPLRHANPGPPVTQPLCPRHH